MEGSYQVYVLKDARSRRYIGMTEDIALRLSQHNSGKSQWTARSRSWTMIWSSRELSLRDARKLENLMKRQHGGQGLQRLMSEYSSGS